MSERPILFSAGMIRAILAGTKTQTRRVIKIAPHARFVCRRVCQAMEPHELMWSVDGHAHSTRVAYDVGDRLWVRETWSQPDPTNRYVFYRADCDEAQLQMEREVRREVGPGAYAHWRPSIYMPRWASRITLEITNVRVERVQDISAQDSLAEGVPRASECGCGWEANPWCWCLTFGRVEAKP